MSTPGSPTGERPPERCRVYKVPCPTHGFIHGAEAEELREGIEELLADGEGATAEELQRLLERVDARDSLSYLEATRRGRKART